MEGKLIGGSLWRPKNSDKVFRIVTVCLLEKTLVPHIVYTEESAGNSSPVWVRPLDEFLRLDGRFEPAAEKGS